MSFFCVLTCPLVIVKPLIRRCFRRVFRRRRSSATAPTDPPQQHEEPPADAPPAPPPMCDDPIGPHPPVRAASCVEEEERIDGTCQESEEEEEPALTKRDFLENRYALMEEMESRGDQRSAGDFLREFLSSNPVAFPI